MGNSLIRAKEFARMCYKAYGFGAKFCYNEFLYRTIGNSRLPISKAETNKFQSNQDFINSMKFLYFASNQDLKNKKVLEIGGSNILPEILFQKLKVSKWTSVDYLDAWVPSQIEDMKKNSADSNEFGVFKLDKDSEPFHDDYHYVKYHGDANVIPASFYSQFDAVVSTH